MLALKSRSRAPAGTPLPGRRLARALILVLTLAALLLQAQAAPPAGAFGVAIQTGVDAWPTEPGREDKLDHISALGARFIRLELNWEEVAPANPPPGFNPANPEEPAYNWGPLDRVIADVEAHGLTPFVDILGPPRWAQSPRGAGAEYPDPVQLSLFAQAMATRYDGSHPGLPWVRYWEVWNEPNVSFFLKPQIQGDRYVSVENYRTMINLFADAVHAVRPDDFVIAGELFPNGLHRGTVTGIAPLEFTRRVLCLSPEANPKRVCSTQVRADAWSVHPYTTGGPSTLPANPDNVWLADLQSLSALVRTAQRLGTLVSSQPVQTWVTEFSWDSSPPFPQGVPAALEGRWVAEALYRGWRAGISMFSWFSLSDEAVASWLRQDGLYFGCSGGTFCEQSKPAGQAFRFPFVAYRSKGRHVLIWGRTPAGRPARVTVQWLSGRGWRTLRRLNTDSDGVFTSRPSLPPTGNLANATLRALTSGETSLSFSLHHLRDIIVQPFG
jgi:hypothetical protein